jgi:hypothetical protein
MQSTIPPALATIAQGRDHITTAEYAKAVSKSVHAVRKAYATYGHSYGVTPVKVGGTHLWPVAAVAALLNGSAK